MYLDFKAISKDVLFKALLDHLNIEYTEKKGELRGEAKFKFIINIEKNLFLCPGNSEVKGSVINFLFDVNYFVRSASTILAGHGTTYFL